MDRVKDNDLLKEVVGKLKNHAGAVRDLPGISSEKAITSLAAQVVDSIRRIDFLKVIATRPGVPASFTPYSGSFEPHRGAGALLHRGANDDAYWLTYLATHFGKHKIDRWNLTEDVYGRLGQGGVWDWATANADPIALEGWFQNHFVELTTQGRSRRFSNHRKYESLKPGPNGAGRALRSYVEWVGGYGSHADMIAALQERVGQNPQAVFAELYRELNLVRRLGRLGKFDLLCNLSNLMIAPIYPDKSYIAESSGPKAGAKLLFGKLKSTELEQGAIELSHSLGVSPQVIEDSLCNWQKSPAKYVYFRG